MCEKDFRVEVLDPPGMMPGATGLDRGGGENITRANQAGARQRTNWGTKSHFD